MNQSKNEHRPPEMVEVIKMIKIDFVKGNGTEGDPVRNEQRYYDMDGNLVFEVDNY